MKDPQIQADLSAVRKLYQSRVMVAGILRLPYRQRGVKAWAGL